MEAIKQDDDPDHKIGALASRDSPGDAFPEPRRSSQFRVVGQRQNIRQGTFSYGTNNSLCGGCEG
jgi:hypothetical protein